MMKVDGINDRFVQNTLDSTKATTQDSDFEKRLKKAFDEKDEKALKKQCQEFETIFLNMLYKEMKATVPKEELMPTDPGKEIFQNMLDENLMDKASDNRSFGLGDMLFKQLSRQMKLVYKLEPEAPTGETKTDADTTGAIKTSEESSEEVKTEEPTGS